jgi:tripartite-type tricarboxylate transporter receptor subunit TctC
MTVVAAAALMLSVGGAWAQNWPTKPVKLINGYPPGGGADILARMVAEKLTEVLGQQVIVDNRTGATGLIAAAAVAAKLVALGFQPLGGGIEDMKQTIKRDRAKWKAVIEAQGIRLE